MLHNLLSSSNGATDGMQSTLFAGSFSSASGIGMSGVGIKRSLSDDGEDDTTAEELGGGIKRARFESLDES